MTYKDIVDRLKFIMERNEACEPGEVQKELQDLADQLENAIEARENRAAIGGQRG